MTEKIEEINPTVTNPVEKAFGRADFLNIEEPLPIKKYIKSLKTDVYFRVLSGADVEDWDNSLIKIIDQPIGPPKMERDLMSSRTKWLVVCLCDSTGRRLFKPGEHGLLDKKPAKVLKELFEASQEVNSISEEDLNDTRKNLSTEPSLD